MFTGYVDKSGEISFSTKVKSIRDGGYNCIQTAGNYNEKGIFRTPILIFHFFQNQKGAIF
jgi:hypothetical protein